MRRCLTLKIVALCAVAFLMMFVALAVAAEDAAAPKPLELTLERMADILTRLDAELAAVDRPAADRLGQRVEEAAALVADVLASLGSESEDPASPKAVVRLDLTLHRLVALLEEIVGEPRDRPERAKARMALDELRAWVDGYVAAAAGMNARERERFDRAAHDLARALAAQIARTANKADSPEAGNAGLPQLVARLEALTLRLDELLLRQTAPKPDSAAP